MEAHPTVRIENAPEGWKGELFVLTRTADDMDDWQSCHLFLYVGTDNPGDAFEAAAREYRNDPANAIDIAELLGAGQDFTWFDMMGEWGDYAEAFAKHGLIEIGIPMGMSALVKENECVIEEDS